MKFVALSFSDIVFIMLINVKMPTIVGILTFMSRMNLVLSSGPGLSEKFGYLDFALVCI